jgi:hypothetical protein
MIGFTEEHRQRFRVSIEEGGVRTDPYAFVIEGSRGQIYVHAPGVFGVATIGNRLKLRAQPWLTVTQDGDDGFNAVFPAERLKAVARLIGSYRRRKLSPEHRAKSLETLAQINQNRSRNRSEAASHPEQVQAA